jgi:alpha-maltose-1-phosphate synthase
LKRLKIAVVTGGRFHVCDLARELTLLGHDVKFYSLVPPWRTKKFGLPEKNTRWLMPWVSHWYAVRKLASKGKRNWWDWADEMLLRALDRAAARVLEPCDVLIGMSGLCNEVAMKAKKKYGAKVWIERGSRHINSQREILKQIPKADQVPDFAIKREQISYDSADVISVLSQHCLDSFLDQGFSPTRLVKNPLGVDLKMFSPTIAPENNTPTVIMTGTWSLRKGCDVLLKAWEQLGDVRLIHVGIVGDMPIPNHKLIIHHDKVDQSELKKYYQEAHVFALASREEGLATVQPQALACGLRLVCSNRTGGEDLKQWTKDPTAIRVVPVEDATGFANAIRDSLNDCRNETGLRDRLGNMKEHLTWKAYAQRYEQNIYERL